MFGNYAIPKDGFAGTGGKNGYMPKAVDSSHNVASTSAYAKVYPLGTIIYYFNETLGGPGACMYLQYNAGAETLAAGYPCGPEATTGAFNQVTGDQSAMSDDGMFAIALSAMTDTYYGWFWIWGVCPDFETAANTDFSATTVVTDGNIVAGCSFTPEFSTTDGKIILGVDAEAGGTAKLTRMGHSIAADSATPNIAMQYLWLYNTWQ